MSVRNLQLIDKPNYQNGTFEDSAINEVDGFRDVGKKIGVCEPSKVAKQTIVHNKPGVSSIDTCLMCLSVETLGSAGRVNITARIDTTPSC